MQKLDETVLTALERAERFIQNHADTLGAVASSGTMRRFADMILAIERATVDQESSRRLARAASARHRVLRNALRLVQMRPIATIAFAELRHTTEVNALQMPPDGTTSRELIIAARAMADAGEPHVALFVEMGLPTDCLARLRAAADALETCLADRSHIASSMRCELSSHKRGCRDVERADQARSPQRSAIAHVQTEPDARPHTNRGADPRGPRPGNCSCSLY